MNITKKCTTCNRTKELHLFHNHPTGKYGKQSWCKACRKKYPRKYSNKKSWDLKKKYGLERQDYLNLKERQEDRCAICRIHEDELKTTLFVDRCHNTNIIRGLLCHNCNIGMFHIERLKDKLDIALNYIQRNV